MSEIKVVFEDGGQIRALRGHDLRDEGEFFTLVRRDGEVSIRKGCIQKIERRD